MKKTNKGFSLVELIIVIAIMAILAAALAPALIRYIDKSRRSSDLSNAGLLQSAAQSAAADEKAYSEIATKIPASGEQTVLSATDGGAWGLDSNVSTATTFLNEFTSTAGKNAPGVKLKKGVTGGTGWSVKVTAEGGFTVYVGSSQLIPSAQGPWAN